MDKLQNIPLSHKQIPLFFSNLIYSFIKKADQIIKPPAIYTPFKLYIPNSKFLPNSIKFNIKKLNHCLTFSQLINNKQIDLYFYYSNEPESDIIYNAKLIYMWCYIVLMSAPSVNISHCSDSLTIYIYFSNVLKIIPKQGESINVEHVNSGFSYTCTKQGEIVVFRKEDWLKVFIHETFHSFGLDFSNSNQLLINEKLNKIFSLNIDYNLFEAYAETWARIINCAFRAYIIKNEKEKFVKQFNQSLHIERLFSLYQCNKIIKLTNFFDEPYKENTSVFAYYVLTSILMDDYAMFINHFKINKELFNISPSSINSFIQLIKKIYGSHLKSLDVVSKTNIPEFNQTMKLILFG